MAIMIAMMPGLVDVPFPPRTPVGEEKARAPPAPPAGLFRKTKQCMFYQIGNCARGAACAFAHGGQELRPLPDLKKTKMCPLVMKHGRCMDGATCVYAHHEAELRGSLPRGNSGNKELFPSACPFVDPPNPQFVTRMMENALQKYYAETTSSGDSGSEYALRLTESASATESSLDLTPKVRQRCDSSANSTWDASSNSGTADYCQEEYNSSDVDSMEKCKSLPFAKYGSPTSMCEDDAITPRVSLGSLRCKVSVRNTFVHLTSESVSPSPRRRRRMSQSSSPLRRPVF
jgi:hypothetical protein